MCDPRRKAYCDCDKRSEDQKAHEATLIQFGMRAFTRPASRDMLEVQRLREANWG